MNLLLIQLSILFITSQLVCFVHTNKKKKVTVISTILKNKKTTSLTLKATTFKSENTTELEFAKTAFEPIKISSKTTKPITAAAKLTRTTVNTLISFARKTLTTTTTSTISFEKIASSTTMTTMNRIITQSTTTNITAASKLYANTLENQLKNIVMTIVPLEAPTIKGSVVPVCNQLAGFSVYSNNITICNKDASGKIRQVSEVGTLLLFVVSFIFTIIIQ